MKKRAAYLIALPVFIILFLTSHIFGQSPGKWDPWQKANCYSGISFSVSNMGYSKNAGGYLWGIRLRNDYDIPVTFSYKLTIGEEYKGEYGFDVTKNLKPGEIWTDGGDLFTAKLFKSPSTNYFYRIKGVCFNNPYCDKKCFAECDLVAGKANHQDDCSGNSSAQKGTQQDSGENSNTDKKPSNSGFPSMEVEVIAIADYICQMMQFEEMYKEKEPDEAAIKKYSELKDKGTILLEAFEKKYTSEKDLSLYKAIYEREMKKCKIKPSSGNASKPDISAMNGEWNSDDGLYTVITKTRGNGFDAWSKDDVAKANKVYYNTISPNEYRYTSPSGTKMVLKMINSDRLESFENGRHFNFFTRSSSSSNETDQATKNNSSIEEREQTVKIGTQTWSTKNLDVSTYRNGDVIPQVQDANAWKNLVTGAWCYYQNDSKNGVTYGKLYNWYAVNDNRGLAPEGYHIPSDAEWFKLTDFLDGDYSVGNKMKSASGWKKDYKGNNGNGTNESGFDGLPGGKRIGEDGLFDRIGLIGGWWSSSQFNSTLAWFRLLYNIEAWGRTDQEKQTGYSVRCLKD